MIYIGDDMNTNEKKFTKQVVVMCDPASIERWDLAAKKCNKSRSVWIRFCLDREADSLTPCSAPPHLPEPKVVKRVRKVVESSPRSEVAVSGEVGELQSVVRSMVPLASEIEKQREKEKEEAKERIKNG